MRGESSDEHYCPGFIDNVDRWERERKLPAGQRGNPNIRENDLIRNGKRMLIFYGLPFAALRYGAGDRDGIRRGLRELGVAATVYSLAIVGPVMLVIAPWLARVTPAAV